MASCQHPRASTVGHGQMSWKPGRSVSMDLAGGNRWTTRQAGGWHQGFCKQVAGSVAQKQKLIPFKNWSHRVALLSQTTKIGIHRQRKQTKGQDLKPGFMVKDAPS